MVYTCTVFLSLLQGRNDIYGEAESRIPRPATKVQYLSSLSHYDLS